VRIVVSPLTADRCSPLARHRHPRSVQHAKIPVDYRTPSKT
jgi:hypothetical protein